MVLTESWLESGPTGVVLPGAKVQMRSEPLVKMLDDIEQLFGSDSRHPVYKNENKSTGTWHSSSSEKTKAP